MPEPHDHGENHIELPFVEPVAMSLYLRMHDVLRTPEANHPLPPQEFIALRNDIVPQT